MHLKTIKRIHDAHRDDIANLITRRPVPGPQLDQVDPFLFLNHHGPQTYGPDNSGLPFGPHPHRGFETVTLILQGELMHRDSAGHESVIREGGVQWMTAGSGLTHSELSPDDFKQHGGPLEILQLWINLPSHLKMTPPAYTGLQADAIPIVTASNGLARIHLVSGSLPGHTGPIRSLTGVFMSWVDLQPGAQLEFAELANRNVFLYIVRGSVKIQGQGVPAFTLVEFNDAGDSIALSATDHSTILFGHAEPIGEPVVSHGPFVMNTREEIIQAIHDFQAGKFS